MIGSYWVHPRPLRCNADDRCQAVLPNRARIMFLSSFLLLCKCAIQVDTISNISVRNILSLHCTHQGLGNKSTYASDVLLVVVSAAVVLRMLVFNVRMLKLMDFITNRVPIWEVTKTLCNQQCLVCVQRIRRTMPRGGVAQWRQTLCGTVAGISATIAWQRDASVNGVRAMRGCSAVVHWFQGGYAFARNVRNLNSSIVVIVSSIAAITHNNANGLA